MTETAVSERPGISRIRSSISGPSRFSVPSLDSWQFWRLSFERLGVRRIPAPPSPRQARGPSQRGAPVRVRLMNQPCRPPLRPRFARPALPSFYLQGKGRAGWRETTAASIKSRFNPHALPFLSCQSQTLSAAAVHRPTAGFPRAGVSVGQSGHP